ncbi:MAG TPA: hypothetical protein PKO09_17805 [Anaerolineae bacterium]|nr:hypothetical protein [Anaerolineae bacterium]
MGDHSMEPARTLAEYWPAIDGLIAHARADSAFQEVLHYGTPEQKRIALQGHGLSFEDLVFIHHELETIVFQGSLRFWWW